MIREIVQIGDPILEMKTVDVEDIQSAETQGLIDDLLETCIYMENRSAGLSAPQIGVGQSIFVCRRTDREEEFEKELEKKELTQKERDEVRLPSEQLWDVMINPMIRSFSTEKSYFWEGCLSIGVTEKDTIFGPVERPDVIEIEYTTREGEKVEMRAGGFFAHIIQHEYDHLNGILFISRVPNPEINLWKSERLDKYIKKHKKYPEVG